MRMNDNCQRIQKLHKEQIIYFIHPPSFCKVFLSHFHLSFFHLHKPEIGYTVYAEKQGHLDDPHFFA